MIRVHIKYMKLKQLLCAITLAVAAFCNISCETTDAKVGLPIPFTDPATRVAVDIKATVLPPRFCVGLDILQD